MSYRDDLHAARARADAQQARADAAERKAAELAKRIDELQQKGTRKPAPRDPAPREHARGVPIPERFDVTETESALAVSWRWFDASEHIPWLFFCFVWDLLMGALYARAFYGGGLNWEHLFAIVPLAMGVGLTYGLLAGLFNRTTVRATDGTLTVRHGPVPWRGNLTVRAAEIKQLYVLEVVNAGDNTTSTWDVCLLPKGGKEERLVRKLKSHAQGLYLEAAFEQHLDIKDRRVPSEAWKKR